MSPYNAGISKQPLQAIKAADWNRFLGVGNNWDVLTTGWTTGQFLKGISIAPGDWEFSLAPVGLPLISGTLNPDQKPTDLGTADAGVVFHATDFDRMYRWNGTAWKDFLSAVPRDAIVKFDVDDPGPGWQLCDGSAVQQSTASGGIVNVTVPDYRDPVYMKLVGGPNTLGPTPASGSVASAGGHLHTVDSHTHGVGSLSASHNHGVGTLSVGNSAGQVGGAADQTIGGVSPQPHSDHSLSGSAANNNPLSGNSGPASPGTSSVPDHQHGPGSLELRRTELKAFLRL